ncbi:MAG TPA: low affinity iron permease family protein [Pseudolysinimonas sp.]|jgi:low affinity Fe/Cu permease
MATKAAQPAKSTKSTASGSTAKSAEMPEDVSAHVGWFDNFATSASKFVSRAWFFAFCVLLVVVWAPSILLIHSISTWQLIINTLTTIITFLLVALLQNTQERSDRATQDKLNAIAQALSKIVEKQGDAKDAAELRAAVGLEDRESSDGK